MTNIEALKEKLKRKIDDLSEDKLDDAILYIGNLNKKNSKEKILSFAGSWKDLDEKTMSEFTDQLYKRRRNNRTRLL